MLRLRSSLHKRFQVFLSIVQSLLVIATITILSARCWASEPPGWSTSVDIGSPATSGSDSYSSGVLTMIGAGLGPMVDDPANVAPPNGPYPDQYHFAFTQV